MWLFVTVGAVVAACTQEVYVAVGVGGFLTVSLLLHRFPGLVHTKKRHARRPVHISHRGGAGEAYENTIHAFEKAVTGGTCMLELDCHLTKDGVVVVAHDEKLHRMTGKDVVLSELLYNELPLLQEAVPMHFERTSYDGVGRGGGSSTPLDDSDVAIDKNTVLDEDGLAYYRGIATLESVFARFPDVMINIDVKVHNEELVRKINALVTEFKREPLTVWGSARARTANVCYAANPEIPLFCSAERTLLIVVLFHCGLLPFVPLKERFFEIPMPSIFHRLMTQKTCTRTGLVHLIDALLFRSCLFAHLERRGILPLVWVLNQHDEFARAYRTGAVGVMTDYPSRLQAFLDANPKYVTRQRAEGGLNTPDSNTPLQRHPTS